MKNKNLTSGKLNLNKTTLKSLQTAELSKIAGGDVYLRVSIYTNCKTCDANQKAIAQG